MSMMKAAQFVGLRSAAVRDVPFPPHPEGDEVLIRVEAVGICGSDGHYYLQGRIGNQVLEYPFTFGHECCGTIEACGPGTVGLMSGDKVAIDPAVSCGACDQCRAGRPHTCRNLLFMGCPGQLPGALSQFILMPARNCFKLSAGMSFTQGALSEPLSIGVYAVELMGQRHVETLGILGAGPIGLSVLLAAQAFGLQDIYVTDKVDVRLKAAERAGAVWIGNPDRADIVAAVLEQRRGLDAVFECCGDPEALDQAVELLNPGGTLIIVGIPEADRISFDIHKLRRKEICVRNVRRQNQCTRKALDLMTAGSIDVAFMATHFFPLADIQKALETVTAKADGVIKAVITVA